MSLFIFIGYRVLLYFLIIEVLEGVFNFIIRSIVTGIVLASRYSPENLSGN
mgnify:CR=1 FL=1